MFFAIGFFHSPLICICQWWDRFLNHTAW